jgi:lipopolysaccharide transport system ATP-binding protein
MSAIIRVQGLSKKYVIGHQRQKSHDTLRDMIGHHAHEFSRRLLHPFSSSRSQEKNPAHEEFWALRDINFELVQGERLGIIGRNGAGKSTLLKILSRITEPTSGSVTIRGRVASLLEVGTGFHPELTGRENVFLNGAILGMSRREIQAKFDEIVDFAEVEKFIDTPVKRYSSGMTVRLAFAVAAHLEPDILIADEVLAVGDIAFQRKSLGKMEDAAKQGRTVLFVSHNLAAVRNLCPSVLVIEKGHLRFHGPTEDGVGIYEEGLSVVGDTLASTRFQGPLSDRIRFEEITYRQSGSLVTIIDPLLDMEIEVRGSALKAFQVLDLNIGIFRDGFHLAYCHDAPRGCEMREGPFRSRFYVPANVLKPGRYTIAVGALASGGDWTMATDAAVLDVSENWGDDSAARDRGAVSLRYTAERIQ